MPAEGQRFVRWYGACTDEASCALTLGAGQAVTALFAPGRLPLTLSVVGRGSVAGTNVRCSCVR